jgi:hypothetical protein
MKPSLPCLLVLFFALSARANTTYYSTNNANPNSTSSWHTNRNGTGSIPSNFNGGDIFVIQANHNITTTANWSLGGTDSKIIVESGAILKANHKITVDIFQADNNATYIHNDNSSAFPGSDDIILAVTSTVEINDWNGSSKLPASVNWGNLIIDMPGYTSNMNQAGDLNSIAGNFIIRSTGNANKEFRLATMQDYTLTIGGDLIIEGGTLEASSGNANADQLIIINGSFIQTGGTFVRSNNNSNVLNIQFNGSNSSFTQSAGVLTSTYINWKVNAGKKLTLNNNIAVAASRSFTVNGTLDATNRSITGAGSFIAVSGSSIITYNTSGLPGSLSTGAVTLNSGVSYEFLAATTTPFPSSILSIAANDLKIGANVTLNKDVTVADTLTLNSGKLTIPVGNTLTVSSGNAVAGSAFGSTKHIATQVNTSTGAKGYFRVQNFTGTNTIPVGNGTYYLPVTLTAPATNDFSICVFSGVTANGQPNGTAFNTSQKKTIVDAVWQVNRNSGSGNTTMQLGWPSVLEGSLFQNIADNQIGIAHYGTYWEVCIGSGNQSQNICTRTNITSFSPFGVGYTGVVLPLKFGELRATQKDHSVHLDWSSFSEYNLDHYEVERSIDGRSFIPVANIACNGNSESRKDYSHVDPVSTDGIFFYRVKGVDKDFHFIYSGVVKISIAQQSAVTLSLYPNPTEDKKITVQATNLPQGRYRLNVYDPTGSIVYQHGFNHDGGSISQQFQLPVSLNKGIYTISLTNSSEIKLVKPLVVK